MSGPEGFGATTTMLPMEAAAQLAAEVEGFVRDTDAERLRLYRMHLQLNVRSVSPLVRDLAAFGGSDLSDLAMKFEPPSSGPWSGYTGADPVLAPNGVASFAEAPRRTRYEARRCRCVASRPRGVISSPSGSGAADITFTVVGDNVEVLAQIGGVSVQTYRGVAILVLPDLLPQTMLIAMPGRSLEDVVAHPVLRNRGYVVETVEEPPHSAGHVVKFRTGLVDFEMPWPDLIGHAL